MAAVWRSSLAPIYVVIRIPKRGEIPLSSSIAHPPILPLRLQMLAIMLVMASLVGCRGRARDDLYMDTMAAEIRDLEDQCYEYDYEYHRLEQEYDSLKRELAIARRDNAQQNSDLDEPDSFLNRSSADPLPRSPARIPSQSPPIQAAMPSLQRDTLPAPATGETNDFDEDEFSAEGLPHIEMGEPIPPPVAMIPPAGSGRNVAPENDLELSLSRIEVPSLMASHAKPIEQPLATLTPAVERLTDRRVVEIVFHPTLTRAIDIDRAPGDDGVYLVLQPKNAHGQFVPSLAKLTVVVVDPARQQNNGVIGHWDYTPAELEAKVRPIGLQQGMHLSLPWNGPNPIADRVVVLVRYTAADGRQVAAEREVMLSSDEEFKAVWTPRETDAESSIRSFVKFPTNVVRPASGTSTQTPAPSPVQSAGGSR